MKTTREKIGKISADLWNKTPESADATEQMREQLTEYDKNLFECIAEGKKKHPTEDFYIVVITKKERLMPNVIRNYFFPRSSCPTPDYDQTVYKYSKSGDIEFIWVIPKKEACLYMIKHALEVEEKELLGFVLDFLDGTLMKKAMILNNEIEGN